MVVMVVWYHTASSVVLLGATPAEDEQHGEQHGVQPVVRVHLILFYALSITLIGSYLSVVLEKLEERIKRIMEQGGAHAALSGKFARGLVQTSNMLQDALGYLTGCAWTDLICEIFSSLNADPTLSVILTNIAVTTSITFVVVYWLAVSGESLSAITDATNREDMERYFITNSMAYFVGWTWLVVTRNLFAPFALTFEMAVVWLNGIAGLAISPLAGANLARPLLGLTHAGVDPCWG